MPLSAYPEPACPFCKISEAYPAAKTPIPTDLEEDPLAHLVLNTPYVLAFLDHQPMSRGHVLVATRAHRVKLSDISVEEGQAIGAWLGIVSRAVVRSVEEEAHQTHAGDSDIGDWNVVQNNGARAAQVVPHVHFHIIPRTSDVSEVKAKSWTMFGKGQREDLEDEDAAVLRKRIRQSIEKELEVLGQREGQAAVRQLLGNEQWFATKPKL